MELLGRSAVPLLGMISGWLVAGSASHRTYGALIGGKTRTILLPMLLWNLLARSEEHTSELQSLMRISYAVFCLKKKTQNTNKPITRYCTPNLSTLTLSR